MLNNNKKLISFINDGPSNTQIIVQGMKKVSFRVKRLQNQIWVCHTVII